MRWKVLWIALLLAQGHSALAITQNCRVEGDKAVAYPENARLSEIQGGVRAVFATDAAGDFAGLQAIYYSESIPPRFRDDFKQAVLTGLKSYHCKPNALLARDFAFKLIGESKPEASSAVHAGRGGH